MSLRTRLLVVTTLTLAVGLAVLCLAGNVLFAQTVRADQLGRLNARLTAVTASLSVGPTGRVRARDALNDDVLDADAWIFTRSDELLEGSADLRSGVGRLVRELGRAGRPRQALGPHEVLLGSQPVRLRGREVATVVAGVSIAQFQALRRDVLLGSVAVALAILSIGILAVRRALGAALAPVERMTRDAEEWGAHDLDRRFALGGGRDEITGLATTLDHLLERIAASRRHEQRFAAEIAHELRTPLAAIQGTAELAADAEEPEQTGAALREITNHSRRIAATLDTLMSLARRETVPAADGVDLEAVAASFPGVEVRADRPLARAQGDPDLIRQTLAPVVENAHRHAATRVTLELAGGRAQATVTVRDDGPGVDRALAGTIFLPGVRGAEETAGAAGLGLPLAQRLARSCGGELTVADGPGGCFVLALPVIAAPAGDDDRGSA